MGLPFDSVVLGDCTQVMATFPADSVDCIVTDPPYGLNFMGKQWDKALPPKAAFSEMCRVLKPGALAFVMSSPRQDLMWRMAQLLEESGFELGQSFISWVYASGFPKAYDISKGIDAKKGLKQKQIGVGMSGKSTSHNNMNIKRDIDNGGYEFGGEFPVTEPASSEAKRWSGWKSVTGLKPALEVIFMVQKPLSEKTIVDNVLRWGTGAMNVDTCRIPIGEGESVDDFERSTDGFSAKSGVYHNDEKYQLKDFNSTIKGRFPANLLVSDDALNDGKEHTGNQPKARGESGYQGGFSGQIDLTPIHYEVGSFSRYFDLDAWSRHHGFLNVPKADTGERDYGLKGEKQESLKWNSGGIGERLRQQGLGKRHNTHPTVKPVELMGYLIELGCPLGGVVLDPFVGSGTTCVAAKHLRRKYIGIEIDAEFHRIACGRVAAYPVKLDGFAGLGDKIN